MGERLRKKIKACFKAFVEDFKDVEEEDDAARRRKKRGGAQVKKPESEEVFKYRYKLKKMCQEKEYMFFVDFRDIWAVSPNLTYWLCECPLEILPIMDEVATEPVVA